MCWDCFLFVEADSRVTGKELRNFLKACINFLGNFPTCEIQQESKNIRRCRKQLPLLEKKVLKSHKHFQDVPSHEIITAYSVCTDYVNS